MTLRSLAPEAEMVGLFIVPVPNSTWIQHFFVSSKSKNDASRHHMVPKWSHLVLGSKRCFRLREQIGNCVPHLMKVMKYAWCEGSNIEAPTTLIREFEFPL
jgi:hypothetical protein